MEGVFALSIFATLAVVVICICGAWRAVRGRAINFGGYVMEPNRGVAILFVVLTMSFVVLAGWLIYQADKYDDKRVKAEERRQKRAAPVVQLLKRNDYTLATATVGEEWREVKFLPDGTAKVVIAIKSDGTRGLLYARQIDGIWQLGCRNGTSFVQLQWGTPLYGAFLNFGGCPPGDSAVV